MYVLMWHLLNESNCIVIAILSFCLIYVIETLTVFVAYIRQNRLLFYLLFMEKFTAHSERKYDEILGYLTLLPPVPIICIFFIFISKLNTIL